ncbi:unnamed protein product [Rhizoctonia solani]|uniref:Uncharacterized protein n=1 Tax=Rhizoctonia solani TaxID=456999 RepID=A0A8H3E0S3_9AGAM|nr:unnamed protein product [Rhizoctonia solani]
MAITCPAEGEKGQGNPWYAGQIGWIISGAFVLATFIVTSISVGRHARNYRVPKEQRQIIRILYMPFIYSSIGFLSYRFIDKYTYLSLVSVVYESLAVCAFLFLMIQYAAKSTATGSINEILAKKNKAKLPIPCCCFRYRPTKPSFMHTVKWLVLQFVIIRPIMSIISIICHALGVLCPSSMSPVYPKFWLNLLSTQTMVVAMFGLLLFYTLNRQELNGHQPILKFAVIKVVVALTVLQEPVLKLLGSSGVIKATQHWSTSHVVDALNAFALIIEMTLASIAMLWAFSASEYRKMEAPCSTVTQAIMDSLNFGDFIAEMRHSSSFFYSHIRNRSKSSTRSLDGLEALDLNEAVVNEDTLRATRHTETDSTLWNKTGAMESTA